MWTPHPEARRLLSASQEGCLPWKFLTPQPLATVREAYDSRSARCVLSAGPRCNATAARHNSSLPVLGRAHGGRAYARHLSLSRLKHRLPRGQTHPEIMQGTAEFYDPVADTLLPQVDAVFDNTRALHAAVDRLDAPPTLVQGLVGPLLLPRQLRAPRCLRRHEDVHLGQRECAEAQLLNNWLPAGRG